eukprot:gene9170-6598_t
MDSKDAKDAKDIDTPYERSLMLGYNQTYIVLEKDREEQGNEVLFRCGNWCYRGLVQFNGIRISTEEVPVLIPALQKQQGSLRYYCTSKSMPADSVFSKPAQYMEDAMEFIAHEISSDETDKELRKMASVFPWIDDDRAPTYFEMALSQVPDYMDKVSLIASKTYTRGLIIISIYYDRSIYFLLSAGEGDQPLLDVRFPDVSKHGQGLHINSYTDNVFGYKKLTLWHIVDPEPFSIRKDFPKLKTINVSTSNYEQTYCIMKSAWDNKTNQLSIHHDALFRFGSWCYAGRVQLTATIGLHDVPFVIPALRMQQSRLDYYCDVNQVPVTSPFAAALGYIHKITPSIEQHILRSEDTLKALIDRLSNMGLGESVSKWLEGDSAHSFFEFKLSPDQELATKLNNIEMIVTKAYYPSGIVTMTIFFQATVYVCVLEAAGENPLLDSRFPDISGKGRGYQLEAFGDGTEDWPELRKVSIWQTIGALEQEFKDKAASLADAKRATDERVAARELSADELRDTNDEAAGAKDVADRSAAAGPSDAKHSEAEAKRADDASPVATAHHHAHHAHQHAAVAEPAADDKLAAPSTGSPAKPLAGDKAAAEALFLRPKQALPHHLPKLDSLSHKLDDIRKTMGDNGLKAPWDLKGRPLGGGLGPLDSPGPLGKK